MDWLKKIIPTIGGLLAGPLGTAAASAAADALGLSDKSKAAVEKALSGNSLTPEQVASLQAADMAFKQKLAELGIEAEKLSVQDRADARAMQVATQSRVPEILGFVLVGTFLAIICCLLTGSMKLWENQTLTLLLGSLTGSVASVIGFYFGASHQQPK